ncbi:glutamyl-tRNA reductase [Halorhabdus utahensis DSM 12940]|uniref:Glutamyl-tRNA reductase n=1 Tax=Halorhabdus utahensis (strain DSM 12940 / JCM 11049 / AX-2) TaxID=519442 RepID=C7NR73_HALUD|nr:glutamyl-tRNA reductase [Halorhabdus utahensis]ACV12986.1 glutamyl-tRNA reductase [Halorhabdus utahensis DSM 12940]
MKEPGYITAASVAHQHGSVEDIDAAAADSQLAGVEQLLEAPHVTEAFVLQTCNRAERYVVSDDPEAGRAALQAAMPDEVDSTVRTLGHEESLRHLLRVAAGLESLVPGEDQILGQVRDAYEDARHVDGLGPVLEEAVTKAIHVGERARTETAINEGVVSLGSAAVELAERERDLEAATALVIGAGEIGTLAAKAVDARSDVAHLYVANRTVPHAEHVTSIVDVAASAIGLDDVASVVDRADLVVSATGSADPIVEPAAFETTGDTVVIDIGQPRDIPPIVDEQPGTDVFDLDDLEAVTAETRANREAAAARVEDIVEDELAHLLTRYKRTRADDVISTMYESAERVKAREVEQALGSLDLDDEEREVVEAMADSLVNQLLAAPTKSLRDAAEADDWATIDTALALFDPDFGETEFPPSVADVDADVPDRFSRLVDADD